MTRTTRFAVVGVLTAATLAAGVLAAAAASASSPSISVACDSVTVSVAKNGTVNGAVHCTATDSAVIDSYGFGMPTHSKSFTPDVTTGHFSYTPANGYTGTDSFTFTATSGTATSDPATVTLNIANTAPTCTTVAPASVVHDRVLRITPACTDANGDALTIQSGVTAPTHGLFAIDGGTLVYTPNKHYIGTDHISFKATDGVDSTATQTVQITVTDAAPVCAARTVDVLHDRASSITVTCTDSDHDVLKVLASAAQHGSVRVVDSRHLIYRPAPHFTGRDTFLISASDGIKISSGARLSVLVTDRAPRLKAPNKIAVKGKRTFTVTTSDADRDSVQVLLSAKPAHGTVTIVDHGSRHSVTYVPNRRYHGADTFTLRAWDGAASSAGARVHVTVKR